MDGIKDFLSLDKQIIEGLNLKSNDDIDNLNNIYQNKSIYLLNYLQGKDAFVSCGLLTNIKENKIYHKCETDTGSSGSPILLLNNNKVIGVHNDTLNSPYNYNLGTSLIKPIIEFQSISNNILIINKDNSKENIDNSLPNNISSKENKDSPFLVGLQNVDTTCYMNATLQCLCNIKNIVDYFKNNKRLNDIVKNDKANKKLCTSFKLLIDNLYPDSNQPKKDYYAPIDFKDKISGMNPLFVGIEANDAKDLVIFLLEHLHDELNNPSIEENKNQEITFLDQSNKALMFNDFKNNFTKNYRSIISDLFYAVNCDITKCNNCKIQSYYYQIYCFLCFPLKEICLYKSKNNNIIDIYDCFDYEKRIMNMDGENAMYCNYCKQAYSASFCTYLSTGPEILIIILNRGKGIQYDTKINFYFELNLDDYIELKETGCHYELFGVISHVRENDKTGNFIAYCQKDLNHQWFKFNDDQVSPVNNFEEEVINNPMPCVLFYKKIN